MDNCIYDPEILEIHSFKVLMKNASSLFSNTIDNSFGIVSGLMHFSSPSFCNTILVHPYSFAHAEQVLGNSFKSTSSDETALNVPIFAKNNIVINA